MPTPLRSISSVPARTRGLLILVALSSLGGRTARADELMWATYLGGVEEDRLQAITVDASGNVYVAGHTRSGSGVTSDGAHKPVPEGADALLAKWTPDGALLWATCFGGPGDDYGFAVAVRGDKVVLGGRTGSTSGLAVNAVFQDTKHPAPEDDGFVAQFTDDGELEWATYVGGAGLDFVDSFAVDEQGALFVAGRAGLGPPIAGPNAHQPAFGGGIDGYLMHLNDTGARVWGTWYGGPGDDDARSVARRGDTLYLGGHTTSKSGIATPGTFQPVHQQFYDLYVAAFDLDGARRWGSYFGGAGSETITYVAAHPDGGVVLAGIMSTPGLATDGTTPAGEADVILAHLDDDGARLWSTYFGGPKDDYPRSLAVDSSGEVVLVGSTRSVTGIASPGAFKAALAGETDAFAAGFADDALHLWGTYFGGEASDDARAVALGEGRLFLVGITTSTAGITTPPTHQKDHAGADDGFIAAFDLLAPPGTPCTTDDQCSSGNCSDRVCCDTACGNSDDTDCQACSVAAGAAADGTCGARAPGPCRPAATECDLEEACDGVALVCPADLFQDDGTVCADGSCSRGSCIPTGETSTPTTGSGSHSDGQPAPTTGDVPTTTASSPTTDPAPDTTGSSGSPDPTAPSQPDDDAGCGCNATPTPALLALGLLLPRRRRGRRATAGT